jgi:hypothetical protein
MYIKMYIYIVNAFLLMCTSVVYICCLLWIMFWGRCGRHLLNTAISFPLDICPEVRLLVILFITFWRTSLLFSKVAVVIYSISNSKWSLFSISSPTFVVLCLFDNWHEMIFCCSFYLTFYLFILVAQRVYFTFN